MATRSQHRDPHQATRHFPPAYHFLLLRAQSSLQQPDVFTPTRYTQMPPSPSSSMQQSMISLQNRKRRNTTDPVQQCPPTKKIKFSSTAHRASNFPPQFWDNLSKIWLTPRALRELDRRNDAHPPATNPAAPISVAPTTLARFARRGGPDLGHLRGVGPVRSNLEIPTNA